MVVFENQKDGPCGWVLWAKGTEAPDERERERGRGQLKADLEIHGKMIDFYSKCVRQALGGFSAGKWYDLTGDEKRMLCCHGRMSMGRPNTGRQVWELLRLAWPEEVVIRSELQQWDGEKGLIQDILGVQLTSFAAGQMLVGRWWGKEEKFWIWNLNSAGDGDAACRNGDDWKKNGYFGICVGRGSRGGHHLHAFSG